MRAVEPELELIDTAAVVAIYIAPATRLAMKSIDRVEVAAGAGLAGDRYENTRHRHVSVFSTGELAEASARFGTDIDPALTRRNVLVDGGLLPRTPGARMQLGALHIEVVRDAAPCKMLDMEIGDNARASMRRRAGVICRVLTGGTLQVGDMLRVDPVDDSEATSDSHDASHSFPSTDRR
jgi:MOSC domain-containing protein YiiM